MRVRIRGPAGQATIVLPENATIGDLHSQIEEKTSMPDFDIKYGYPPKPLSLKDHDSTVKLSDFSVKLDGEQLIVSGRNAAPATTNPTVPKDPDPPNKSSNHLPYNGTTPSSFSFADVGTAPPTVSQEAHKPLSLTRKPASFNMDAPEVPLPTHSSTLILRIMPDDNSCLFRAFSTAFFGAGIDSMHELRSVVAQHIQSHTDTYSAVVLEKQPDDYCRWIQTEDAWGGAIELDILSRHFELEICSIDVQTLRTDRFNEGMPTRCILVYSGIHYDTIALSPSDPPYAHAYAPPEFDTKIFDAADAVVLHGAVDLGKILQGKHYYTDTAAFTVKCNICGKACVGENGATEHAKKTGHYDFGEAE